MNDFGYTVLARKGIAKAGVITTPHGQVRTPVFMPVGTKASVKALSSDDIADTGAQIVLGNTYHLYLRPGEKVVLEQGGLGEFMRLSLPTLTDSGGYQVSSLGWFKGQGEEKLSKIDDEGVTFFSHLDGSKHRFTPEKAIQIQVDLGADVIMAFDEATPDRGKRYAREAMERTHRWLVRSKNEWLNLEAVKTTARAQALFGIVQGGDYRDLRRVSAEFVMEMELPGVAIGGASIGQSVEQTEENVSWIRDILSVDKPLYLMGVGVGPSDVVGAVLSGADMFDCVAPTKIARSGLLYSGRLEIPQGEVMKARFVSEYTRERINLGNERYIHDSGVIEEGCDCYTCRSGYSRSYLRHLYKAKELLFYRLATIHNVRFMIRLVDELRKAIVGVEMGDALDLR